MPWSYWGIIGIILVVAEIFTGGFGILWFGISAFCAAAASYLGLGWQVQTLIFAVVGLILLFATRPLARRLQRGSGAQFGVKALIGKQGVVTKPIGEAANPVGQIRVEGEVWRARSTVPIPVGTLVVVTGIEGITLLVEPVVPEDTPTR